MIFLNTVGNKVCDGVAIDVCHKVEKSLFLEVASPDGGKYLALLLPLTLMRPDASLRLVLCLHYPSSKQIED